MVRVYVGVDDMYPVFSEEIVDESTSENRRRWSLEIPEEKLLWVQRVWDDFNAMQEYLESLRDSLTNARKD